MGGHLAEAYGEAYYAVGFAFGRGAFQALIEDEDGYELGEHRLDDPRADVPKAFAALERPLAFLDLATARDDPRLGWLDEERQCHSIGAVYDPDHPGEHVRSSVPTAAFDGLLYVDETTRARPLDRD